MADVVVLTRTHAGEAADALAASHDGYPAFRSVLPDPRRRIRALRAFFRATVADAAPFESVSGAVEGERVLGVAAWLPPGAFPWSVWRKTSATPVFLRVFLADPGAFPTFTRAGANAEKGDEALALVPGPTHVAMRRPVHGRG